MPRFRCLFVRYAPFGAHVYTHPVPPLPPHLRPSRPFSSRISIRATRARPTCFAQRRHNCMYSMYPCTSRQSRYAAKTSVPLSDIRRRPGQKQFRLYPPLVVRWRRCSFYLPSTPFSIQTPPRFRQDCVPVCQNSAAVRKRTPMHGEPGR